MSTFTPGWSAPMTTDDIAPIQVISGNKRVDPRPDPFAVQDSRTVTTQELLAAMAISSRTVETSRRATTNWTLIAPGFAVPEDEAASRFGSLDLDDYRTRMAPGVYETFIRFLGAVPNRANVDARAL